ncbi:competence protein ComJ [Bacillus sp. 179-C3.3 HS]|uniref:competence protein ComJ n=1 Tax=Bacillus sp. 179-C3.3 HS TaxID=3232162 RepID=UPI0039A2CB81
MNVLNEIYPLSISYHQITVYAGSQTPPVINWTDEAIQQGYATGDNGVSFEGINNGKASIIATLDNLDPPPSVERMITVPFHQSNDHVHITSVMSQVLSFPIPKGNYELTCYYSRQSDHDMYYFHFKSV